MTDSLTKIYGILFVVGQTGVTAKELAETLSLTQSQVEEELHNLQLQLTYDPQAPIELVHYDEIYYLTTKHSLSQVVKDFAHTKARSRLSRAALETLAIVAYRQPVTRMTVDQIRGVASATMLQNLMTRDLIHEVGRVEAPGRPVLYATTSYFMNYFGLTSLADLPEIEPLELATHELEEQLFNYDHWEMTLYEEEDH